MDQPSTIDPPELTGEVRLVVWDLDDTFWRGTLSEGPVELIPAHGELVKTLAKRGIVSSIASKNDFAAVESVLRDADLWDWFVAPQVSFAAKGAKIADIIESLHLRPDNVVLVDDNPAVLAEAAFACPGLQCLSSPAQLSDALDHPFLAGKDDAALGRLGQYRELARRSDAMTGHEGSEQEFLRQSDIHVTIDYDVEEHLDRVIELINRSNQLNFTKQRILGDEGRAEFVARLSRFGYKAGIVRAWDKYADYGIVGVFVTLATLREYVAEHFVFSCRVMNMGIEQFIYDHLRRPAIAIAEPVANGLCPYPEVDWITLGAPGEAAPAGALQDRALVLIGGCDMLQLSTYCSANSSEFTNREVDGIIKRLDDPFILLADPEAVGKSELRAHVPAFDQADMLELREALATADGVVVSFYRMMEINYFRGRDGLVVRLDEDAVKAILASDKGLWFVRNFAFIEVSHEQRQQLVAHSLDRLVSLTPAEAKVIVLFENTRKLDDNPNEKHLRELYNTFVANFCATNRRLVTLDVNRATSEQFLFDDGFHMARQGYFELAQAVRDILA